ALPGNLRLNPSSGLHDYLLSPRDLAVVDVAPSLCLTTRNPAPEEGARCTILDQIEQRRLDRRDRDVEKEIIPHRLSSVIGESLANSSPEGGLHLLGTHAL